MLDKLSLSIEFNPDNAKSLLGPLIAQIIMSTRFSVKHTYVIVFQEESELILINKFKSHVLMSHS